MNSMTGFGRARAAGEQLDVTVEINSVNRRNLEVAVALPREWQVLERGLTERVRAGLQRGRIQVSVQIDRRSENERLHWDENAVRSILLRLEELAARRGIDFQPDASLLFKIAERVPAPQEELDTEAVAQLVQMAVDEALEEVLAMRRREGRALADDLEGRADTLAHLLREVGSRSKSVVPRYRKILLDRGQRPSVRRQRTPVGRHHSSRAHSHFFVAVIVQPPVRRQSPRACRWWRLCRPRWSPG